MAMRRNTRMTAQATKSLAGSPPARKKRKLSVVATQLTGPAASGSAIEEASVVSSVLVDGTLAASANRLDRGLSPLSELSDVGTSAEAVPTTKVKIKRAEKEADEPVPTHYTRVTSDWKIGAHVSAAGGIENAVKNAAEIGANAFALFLKSQRKWTGPEFRNESISLFKSRLRSFGYDPFHVVPHGSYLVNLGNPDAGKRQKSYECFLDELKRCEQLDLPLYNFHPGSTVGSATKEESITLIAECLNRAHKETRSVITLIENMAGTGNVIGSKFSELASIIDQVENKARVGVCLDTCHMFAAGYDIRTREAYESTLSEFDSQVGMSYLRAMHINDSKVPLGANRDRHENIGRGEIGLCAFALLTTDPRLKNIPLILETPTPESLSVWKTEISVLNRLSGLDPTDAKDRAAWPGMVDEINDAAKAAETDAKKKPKKLSATKRVGNVGKKKERNKNEDAED